MSAFRRFIEKYIHLPDADWNCIAALFEKRIIEKKETILAEGQVCRYFMFLEEGLVRHFILHNGQDITKFIVPAPYCVTSRISFLNGIPAQENIQAIETSVTWQITCRQYTELMKLRSWNEFTRKMLHEVQDYTETILLTNLTETAERRYDNMLALNPDLVNRVPQKHLATYLGIASQSLSRIRNKKAQQKRS